MTFQILTLLFLIPPTLITFYYLMLAAVGLLSQKRKQKSPQEKGKNRFAIIIPAYNEEQTIRNTIRSCLKLQYPQEKYDVVIIADNCTDATADIASKEGAKVMERQDNEKRGKGFALAWGFNHLLKKEYDAFVVLDADCIIESQALTVFDSYLQNGAKVLQANYVVSNPDVNSMSYALAIGNIIENDFFYAPKTFLGLTVFLRGTGMVFNTDILKKIPWNAYSIAEDAEYSLRILRDKIKVHFIKEVKVASEFPVIQRQLKVQRERWAQGNLRLGKSQSINLMTEGLFSRNPLLFDGGWTLILLSRPLVLAVIGLALILSILSLIVVPGFFSVVLLYWAIALVIGMGVYFGFGILQLGINRRRLHLLLQSPYLVIRLAKITISGLFGKIHNSWNRTPR